MTPRDLTAIMRPYAPGTWLLLSPDYTRVLGSGTDAAEACAAGGYDLVGRGRDETVLIVVPFPGIHTGIAREG